MRLFAEVDKKATAKASLSADTIDDSSQSYFVWLELHARLTARQVLSPLALDDWSWIVEIDSSFEFKTYRLIMISCFGLSTAVLSSMPFFHALMMMNFTQNRSHSVNIFKLSATIIKLPARRVAVNNFQCSHVWPCNGLRAGSHTCREFFGFRRQRRRTT